MLEPPGFWHIDERLRCGSALGDHFDADADAKAIDCDDFRSDLMKALDHSTSSKGETRNWSHDHRSQRLTLRPDPHHSPCRVRQSALLQQQAPDHLPIKPGHLASLCHHPLHRYSRVPEQIHSKQDCFK
jgi:hypothetical protein